MIKIHVTFFDTRNWNASRVFNEINPSDFVENKESKNRGFWMQEGSKKTIRGGLENSWNTGSLANGFLSSGFQKKHLALRAFAFFF